MSKKKQAATASTPRARPLPPVPTQQVCRTVGQYNFILTQVKTIDTRNRYNVSISTDVVW